MTSSTRRLAATTLVWLVSVLSQVGLAQESPHVFYAMDTAFAPPYRKTDKSRAELFDMVKDLGFGGVGWTEKAPDQVKADLVELEKRGLKMSAIYIAAKISPEGELIPSPNLLPLMEVLKDQGVILWLHIGGKGPAFDTLTATSPTVVKLRTYADTAKSHGLKIAIYPHLNEWTERFGDATRLAKLVDHANFGVSFNLCHCLAAGDEAHIPRLLADARTVLMTATLSGADSGVRSPDKQLWSRLIKPLGQGTYDVRIVLKAFREIGFTGPVGFQGYGIPGTGREILTPTIKAWRQLYVPSAANPS